MVSKKVLVSGSDEISGLLTQWWIKVIFIFVVLDYSDTGSSPGIQLTPINLILCQSWERERERERFKWSILETGKPAKSSWHRHVYETSLRGMTFSKRNSSSFMQYGGKSIRFLELKVENSKTVALSLWSPDQLKYQFFRHQFLYHLNNSNTVLFRQRGWSAESQQCAAEYKVCLKSIELSLSYGLFSGRLTKQNHSFTFTFRVYFCLVVGCFFYWLSYLISLEDKDLFLIIFFMYNHF